MASADMSTIPVYALAGTILPTYPEGVETLTVEPSQVAGAGSVGDDRIVLAFTGASGSFTEAADPGYVGLSYSMVAAPAGPVTWNGAALAACTTTPAAACATTAPGVVTAYVVGRGVLVAGGSAITASGGDPLRNLTFVVRSAS
jgi:hypothetical protein